MEGTDLDHAAARRLVERGSVTDPDTGEVRFRHDPRLRLPSRLRLTEEQVRAFLAAITCPVLAIRARSGWPFPEAAVRSRLRTLRLVEVVEVEGGHHVHLTHPERVAPAIAGFLAGDILEM